MADIEIADTVHHKQTGEDWIVGRVDDGYVYPCGWPCSRALQEDCTLIKKASEAERASLIENLRRLPSSDPRHIAATPETPR